MKKWLIIFLLACGQGHLTAQNEWVLQTYLEVAGDTVNQELGQFVTGFRNSRPNMPYNVAVGQSKSIGCYMIDAPDDTLPQRIFWGPNLVHGDFNGDGYTDLAVHQSYNMMFGDDLDTVMIYLGNPTGIDTIPAVRLPEKPNNFANYFGDRMASGDLNGDGFDDLAIADPYYFGPIYHPLKMGRVYIYLGKDHLQADYDYAISGIWPENYGLGERCSIGDLNNDGYGDLVITGYDGHGATDSLRYSFIEVYFGSANFDTVRDFYKNGVFYFYSQGLACFDANGDGVADVLWSNKHRIPGRGGPTQAVLIFFGGTDFDLNFS